MKNRQGGLQEVQRFWGRAATVALVAVIAVTLNYGLDAPRRRTLRAGGGACHVSAGRRRVAPGETSQLGLFCRSSGCSKWVNRLKAAWNKGLRGS